MSSSLLLLLAAWLEHQPRQLELPPRCVYHHLHPPSYGSWAPQSPTGLDLSILATPVQFKELQVAVGYLLCYGQSVDARILQATYALTAKQAVSTLAFMPRISPHSSAWLCLEAFKRLQDLSVAGIYECIRFKMEILTCLKILYPTMPINMMVKKNSTIYSDIVRKVMSCQAKM